MAELRPLSTPEGRSRFDELHRLYRPAMLKAAAGVLKDRHLAEDAVQEAFIRIAKNFHKIGEIDRPPTRVFVLTVVRNVSLNMLAKLGRQVPAGDLEPDLISSNSMEEDIFERMDHELVVSAIRSLPPIYREALSFYYLEELTTAEIADRLGIGTEAVKKRVQRGKRMVLDGLEGYDLRRDELGGQGTGGGPS